jgi:alkylhydroperoxidase family enzyme
MSADAEKFRRAAVENVLGGKGRASVEDRRAAFANADVPAAGRALIDKVTKNAWKVTDEDVAAAKAAGLTEDQVFELSVCAAMGQATRQLDAAMAALDEATRGATP